VGFEKKIDDKLFIKMVKAQKPMAKIAEHFGVTDSACYALRNRLIKAKKLDLKLPLTEKQQTFVDLVAQNVAPLEAVKASHSPAYGEEKTVLNRVMAQPAVKEAIGDILKKAGLTRDRLARKLKTHVDSTKEEISLRATVEGFKLHDDYPATKNVNVNVNLDWLPVDLQQFALPAKCSILEQSVEAHVVVEAEEEHKILIPEGKADS
jgi:DNA-binding phage protein